MAPKRLFIAITPPQDLVASLATPLRKVPRDLIRRTPLEQVHITLSFLGDVQPQVQESLMDALAAMPPLAPFKLSLQGAGLLPSKRNPKVLFVAVKESPELFSLKTALDTVLLSVGLTPEERRFTPHLTVARIRDGSDRDLVWDLPGLYVKFGELSFEVASFLLYSSELRTEGPIHRVEAEYRAGN